MALISTPHVLMEGHWCVIHIFQAPPAGRRINPLTRMVWPLAQVPSPKLLLPESFPSWMAGGQGCAHGFADSPFILLEFPWPLSCCPDIVSWSRLLLLCSPHVITWGKLYFPKRATAIFAGLHTLSKPWRFFQQKVESTSSPLEYGWVFMAASMNRMWWKGCCTTYEARS